MSNKANRGREPSPVADYSEAIAKAVSWLGDRYLLAKPINHSNACMTLAVARVASQRQMA
jgi:hypothetical protein